MSIMFLSAELEVAHFFVYNIGDWSDRSKM